MIGYTNEDDEYYEYDEICEEYPLLKRGCKTRGDFIKRHNIPQEALIYGQIREDDWLITNGKNKKLDKLMINIQFINDNLLKKDVRYDPLPEIIKLKKEELFRGPDGKALKIQVVGKRNADEIYFKLKDVSVAFKMKGLCDVVVRKGKNGYQENVHYKTFFFPETGSAWKGKITYLTFEGLLRAIITTKNETAEPYIKWIKETLFTVHLGTLEQKQQLAKKLNGVPVEELRRTLKTSATPVSCVYLFDIVSAKEAPEEMNLKTENGYVCKYGYTSDLATRSMQHKNKYGNIPNAEVVLRLYACVDNEYTSEAETKIRKKLNKMGVKVTYEDNAELVHLTDKQVKEIKHLFLKISAKYCIATKNVAQQMNVIEAKYKVLLSEKDTEIAYIKTEMANKDTELANKDTELANKDTELANKDTELANKNTEMANKNTEMANKNTEIMEAKKDKELMGKDIEILKLKLEIAERR
jgi:hypothetical protein